MVDDAPTSQESDRLRVQLQCLGLGLLTGGGGAAWILAEFERDPLRGLQYHVPLATVFGCWGAYLLFAARGSERWRLTASTAVGLSLVGGRLTLDWPLSGHAVLGALIAVAAPWTWLRVFAGAVVAQTLVTKWWAELDALSAVFGAAAGALLAWLARPQQGS